MRSSLSITGHADVLHMDMVDAVVVLVDGAQHVAAGKGQMAGIEQQRNAFARMLMKASSSGSVSTTAAMWW